MTLTSTSQPTTIGSAYGSCPLLQNLGPDPVWVTRARDAATAVGTESWVQLSAGDALSPDEPISDESMRYVVSSVGSSDLHVLRG